jgi:hypothetical protein
MQSARKALLCPCNPHTSRDKFALADDASKNAANKISIR